MTVLGIHIQRFTEDSARFIETAQPSAVVTIDLGAAPRIRQLSPKTMIIGRCYQYEANNHYLETLEEHIHRHPIIDAWTGPIMMGRNEKRWYDHERARMDMCTRLGTKAVVGNYGVGNLPIDVDWPEQYDRSFNQQIVALGHYVGWHGYGRPMGYAADWLTLRHHHFMAELEKRGWPLPQLLITECGIDDLPNEKLRSPESPWNQPGTGFRSCTDAAEYARQLVWYQHALSTGPYAAHVHGACIFQCGHSDPTWGSFELGDDAEFVALALRHAATETQPPPQVDLLSDMLKREFGGQFEDIRSRLPDKPTPENPTGYVTRQVGGVASIVVHHSAVSSGVMPENIHAYHQTENRWPGIGYHLMVYPDRVYYTGSVSTIRYHAKDHNTLSVGLCLAGDFTLGSPLPGQLDLARRTVAVVRRYLGRQVGLVGHRDLPGQATVCPGNTWAGWQERLEAQPSTEPEIRRALYEVAYNAIGKSEVVYNEGAALQRYARSHELAAPLSGEVDAPVNGAFYRVQAFALGWAYAPVGEWDHVKHGKW